MQKKKFIVLFAALIGMAAFFTGCKYEEGPFLSLRSKKERVANTWKIGSAIEQDGDDVTTAYDGHVLVLTTEGDLTWTGSWLLLPFTSEGNWNFTVDNENVQFQYDSIFSFPFADEDEFQILKLKENELWLMDLDGDKTEFHLVPNE